MKLTKKRMTTAIGMAVGITLLAGAALASYNTSNGYEIGKTAVKGLMSNENYTSELKLALLIDGENINTTEVKELYDRNGDVKLNNIEKTSSLEKYQYYMGSPQYERYVQDGDSISIYHRSDGEVDTSIYKNYINEYNRANGTFDIRIDDEDKETTNKIIRFVELVTDTMVGDLKNNIVYVSGDDSSSSYELNLDAVQIPEVVNAGISAMFSSMSRYDEDDPFMTFGTDPIIKNASLKFTVDSEGRLTDAFASSTLSGNGHEGTCEISLKLYDYGTTKPERIDVSTLQNVNVYNTDEHESIKYETSDESVEITYED